MIIVSGCPRSGTSMMMRIMERIFGEERILKAKERKSKEFDSEFHKYLKTKIPQKDTSRSKDMNPNGYYEMEFCVKGLFYRPAFEELLKNHSDKIVKVVSQGLANSDPQYIDKIVYMVRNPRSVAKSQERLGRDNPMNPDQAPEVNGKRILIRSVQMYNLVTVAAAKWIENHPNIPIHIVNYDDLLDDPQPVLQALGIFLDTDMSSAVEMIDTSLRRSEPLNEQGEEWDFAESLHQSLKEGNFKEIIEKSIIKRTEFVNKKPEKFFCFRAHKEVTPSICHMCKNDQGVLKNMKRAASFKKISWVNEPCSYEMIYEGIPAEKSIEANHWKHQVYDKSKLEQEIMYQEHVLNRMIEMEAKACEIKRQEAWIQKLKDERS